VEIARKIAVEGAKDRVRRIFPGASGFGYRLVPLAAVIEFPDLSVDVGIGLPLARELRLAAQACEIACDGVGRRLPCGVEGLPGSSSDQCQALVGLRIIRIDPGIRGRIDRSQAPG